MQWKGIHSEAEIKINEINPKSRWPTAASKTNILNSLVAAELNLFTKINILVQLKLKLSWIR